MSDPGPGARGFRLKLQTAIMLVVIPITAGVLWFAQRNAEAGVRENLQQRFQEEFRMRAEAAETRSAAIAERCRVLAKSVRIRAALEEDDREDLYLNAAVELRDIVADPGKANMHDSDPHSLRAEFFRFLKADGALMQLEAANPEPWEMQLALPGGAPEEQQTGCAIVSTSDGREALCDIIATPIITTDHGDSIGAIVLGFNPPKPGTVPAAAHIESGLWLNGRLHLPGFAAPAMAELSAKLTRIVNERDAGEKSATVEINGAAYRLITKRLNPGSAFPPAYQVSLYSIAEALARQNQLRWRIIGSGLGVLFVGLILSHFVSLRLSAPVEQMAEASVADRAQCQRAQVALQLTEEKYRSIFENAVEIGRASCRERV